MTFRKLQKLTDGHWIEDTGMGYCKCTVVPILKPFRLRCVSLKVTNSSLYRSIKVVAVVIVVV